MEETKGISYKSKFLLEFYDKSNTYRGMENDESWIPPSYYQKVSWDMRIYIN